MCGSNVLAFLSWFLLNFKIFEFKLTLNDKSFKSATPDSVVAPRVIQCSYISSQRRSVARQHLVTPGHADTWHVTSSLDIFSVRHKHQLWLYDWIYVYYMDPILLVMLLRLSLSPVVLDPGLLGDVNSAIKMLVSANGDICHTRARPIQIFPPLMNTLRMAQRWN